MEKLCSYCSIVLSYIHWIVFDGNSDEDGRKQTRNYSLIEIKLKICASITKNKFIKLMRNKL